MNVVLIGMSGAGKSTLGVLLAKAAGMEFIDTDIIIQKLKGKLLQDIINEEGLDSFLEIEEKVVVGLQITNCVISTGGSVVYLDKAMKYLKKDGNVIYLHVPYEEIEKRVKDIESRGIVIRKGYSLKDTYYERMPLYNSYSDIIFDCSNKSIEQCISGLLKIIKDL